MHPASLTSGVSTRLFRSVSVDATTTWHHSSLPGRKNPICVGKDRLLSRSRPVMPMVRLRSCGKVPCRMSAGDVRSAAASNGDPYRLVAQMLASDSARADVSEDDRRYMRRAVELAAQAWGRTAPNPMVGCVIVKDGQVVGEGFHPKAGEPHAEVWALRAAGDAAKVVVGMTDPAPWVSGQGMQTLKCAGIEVVSDVERDACAAINEPFIHRILHKRPLGVLRCSLDPSGNVLAAGSDCSGQYLADLRALADMVVIDEDTLLAGADLTLTSTRPGCKQPMRVVLSRSLRVAEESAGCRRRAVWDVSAAPALVITQGPGGECHPGPGTGAARDEGAAASNSPTAFLASRGVDLVTLPELTPAAVTDHLYTLGANLVLWEVPPSSPWARAAIAERVVSKVAVTSPHRWDPGSARAALSAAGAALGLGTDAGVGEGYTSQGQAREGAGMEAVWNLRASLGAQIAYAEETVVCGYLHED
eukprot:jgi/Mesvir1/19777/Mv13077-RA.3